MLRGGRVQYDLEKEKLVLTVAEFTVVAKRTGAHVLLAHCGARVLAARSSLALLRALRNEGKAHNSDGKRLQPLFHYGADKLRRSMTDSRKSARK